MFSHKTMPAIRFKIITILPIKVNFNVKNTKHQSTFKTPFTIIKTTTFFGISDFFIHKKLIMPKVVYMIVHTIGITMFGIHWLGFCRLLNQSIPKFTNTLPNTATSKIKMLDQIIFVILSLFKLLILYFMFAIQFYYKICYL